MAAHSTLTGADLHILKGADAASAGQVPVADGAGDSTWTTLNSLETVFIPFRFNNISTASSQWVIPGVAGTITRIQTVINGALGTADPTLSFEIAGTPITSGNITITQAGSAAGDIDETSPSAANVITSSQAIEMISDGASTNNINAIITFTIDVS